jgi:hypothetical protein
MACVCVCVLQRVPARTGAVPYWTTVQLLASSTVR